MALNPISYTEKVIRSFLRYQLTAYPFTDDRLHDQMRHLLNLDKVRHTPLLKGPYITLSRSFREGATVKQLVDDGVFHPYMQQVTAGIKNLRGHQEKAIRAIHAGQTTLVSTGTGSGKTECFLYPIISKCLELKDACAPAGICAVIVYPMNALAEDQLDRLRGLLAGSGVSFGMYVGKTPEHEREVAGHRMKPGSTRADFLAVLKKYRDAGKPDAVYPTEEVCSREMMRTPGSQPRILLTNVKQLELLLTRQKDIELFDGARLDYLVFDEAHTFTGINGAETACLIRRLMKYCDTVVHDTVCIATSATIVDKDNPDAARRFASRFFGTPGDRIACVHEEYEDEPWQEGRRLPPEPPREPVALLKATLAAVDAEQPETAIRAAYRALTGWELAEGDWREALHDALTKNELAYQIRAAIHHPRLLEHLLDQLQAIIKRPVSDEELLTYLALGAAAFKDNRPVFRPVVHAFVRGVPGAVVTFPVGSDEPKLYLSSEDQIKEFEGKDAMWRPQVHACTTCGQHYFVTWLKDFEFTRQEPDGGQLAEDGATVWAALDKDHQGKRAVLLDRVIGMDDDADLEDEARLHPLYFCRYCGSAHATDAGKCSNCPATGDLVKLYAVLNSKDHPGYLGYCLSCHAKGKPEGRRYREPMRPVRAVNVSDVHVLAQDMVQNAERRRLLLFADNRQDAAFQTGWMKDHARRFRLRGLMAEAMKDGPCSVGDMVLKLDERLDRDDSLSRSLIPEVWRVVLKEGHGGTHAEERRHFLRIQVLRELTIAANQQIGLEPWGRLKVHYTGLDASAPFIQEWANKLKLPPEDLKGGIEALLDQRRRQRLLYDPLRGIFTKYWQDGDREIQRGYMPAPPGPPKGMKLEADPGDNKTYVNAWMSSRNSLMKQIAKTWGVADDGVAEFLKELWDYLTDEKVEIMVPVTLLSARDKALANCSGVYQIDAGKIRMSANHGYYRCQRCRRKVTRRTPRNRCMAWNCPGELEYMAEDPDNYDLQLLDEQYHMLIPEEHTAMVPNRERERIENLFKGQGDAINALVCTPTLELGVDIGALDAVMMRNVPPLPANYWQRAGRAGRRHRMAVSLCYCRPISHDRAYYAEPTKMLEGRVDPPAFNLRNDVMVAKHVHAIIITRLHQLAREGSGLSEPDRKAISEALRQLLPGQITLYLFDSAGQIRQAPFDLAPLQHLITKHRQDLLQYTVQTFASSWPDIDNAVISEAALAHHIDQTVVELDAVVKRLRRRLQWAHAEINRLNEVRKQQGTLEYEDDAHFNRCDRLIKKLRGQKRKKSEAEGVDDINTFGVLAAEGFLPGYGLDSGSVVGMAEVPYWQIGSMDFTLPRPTSVALREYVPGNLIYANGHKFVARRFHREAVEEQSEMPVFEVSVEREAISETQIGAAAAELGATMLRAISVCDVDLAHMSQISDEEEFRFQMPVSVFGREKGRHNGGKNYRWGDRLLSIRSGVSLRLVNVGSSQILDQQLGYPVCSVCGQSVSPLSSDAQIKDFREKHAERCGRPPENLGFFADVVADCLALPACPNKTAAYSLLEALRMGATHELEMHLEDLQILVVGHVDRDEVDALLWDPMPGGSGLLDQLRVNFKRVVATAQRITAECPSGCEHSCIDCLQTFRNAHYHKHLDREVARELLVQLGDALIEENAIPPQQLITPPTEGDGMPVNDAENMLKHLLEKAGFTSGQFQHQIRFSYPIDLDYPIGSTTPDVYFTGDPDDADDKGVCIYLDGMSAHLHGNPRTAEKDREIRSWLRGHDYHVIEITFVDLSDHGAMIRHFKKLAKHLSGKEMAKRLEEDTSWMTAE